MLTDEKIDAIAREADCVHVDLNGDRAKALQRLSEFAAAIEREVLGAGQPVANNAQPIGWYHAMRKTGTPYYSDAIYKTEEAAQQELNTRLLSPADCLFGPIVAPLFTAPPPAQPQPPQIEGMTTVWHEVVERARFEYLDREAATGVMMGWNAKSFGPVDHANPDRQYVIAERPVSPKAVPAQPQEAVQVALDALHEVGLAGLAITPGILDRARAALSALTELEKK